MQITNEPKWQILLVAPQMERTVVTAMERAGVRTYLPYEMRRDRHGFQRKWPLVPGYVFALDADLAGVDLKAVNGYRRRLASCSDSQVDRIRVVAAEAVSEQRATMSAGDRVRIRRGAFAEIMAVIVEVAGERATVEFELIGGKTSRSRVAVAALERIGGGI